MEITTPDAVERFMIRCEAKSLAAPTIAAYKWALDEFAARYPGPLPTDPDAIDVHLAGLKRLSVRSRWNVWRCLRTFYNYCQKRLKVENAAADVEAPKLRKGKPKALTDNQVKALLGLPLCRRDRAIILLLLDTGLRLGEISGLKWEDIHDDSIAVEGKTGRRYVPLSNSVRAALVGIELPWRSDNHHKVEQLTRWGVYQVVKRALREAGIRKGGPHILRHTFGVHYSMAGGDLASLQAILGHANSTSTLIYLQLATPQIRAQHAKYSLLIPRSEPEVINETPTGLSISQPVGVAADGA